MRVLNIFIFIIATSIFCFISYLAYRGEVRLTPVENLPTVKACPCVTVIKNSAVGGIFIPNQDKHIYKNFKTNTKSRNESIDNVFDTGDEDIKINNSNTQSHSTAKQKNNQLTTVVDQSIVDILQDEILRMLIKRKEYQQREIVGNNISPFSVLEIEKNTTQKNEEKTQNQDIFNVLE